MKRLLILVGVTVLSLSVFVADGVAQPFRDVTKITGTDGKPPSLEYGLRELRVSIQSLPYFLSVYLDSGDILLQEDVRETLAAVGLYVGLIGKSAQTELEKEVSAKLQVGSQKLGSSVDRSLRAISEFRRVRAVFTHRSALLIHWIDRESDRLVAGISGEGQASELPRLLSEVRFGVLRALFICRVSPWGMVPDPQRSKAMESWDQVLRKAEQVASVASNPAEKEFAQSLISSLNNVRGLAREALAQTDELNQSWEQTLSSVESLANLIQPLFSDNKASGAPADKGGK